MNVIRRIHRTVYNHTKNSYNFNISFFDIKKTDNSEDILKKIDILSHVIAHPEEWYILKKHSQS